MRIVGFVLLSALLPLVVTAQSAPTEFPADAKALAPDALRERLAGKTLKGTLADGVGWRLEFNSANSYFYLDTSRGFRDVGTWKIQDGKLCTELPKVGASCSEVRVDAARVYIKRTSNGEVVALE